MLFERAVEGAIFPFSSANFSSSVLFDFYIFLFCKFHIFILIPNKDAFCSNFVAVAGC